MLLVFFAENGFFNRYMPINAKGFVLDVDAAVSLRMIELIALVLEYGSLGENGEAMGKAPRNKELTMIVFRQFHSYMLAKCRRTLADVNGYVEALRL